MPTPVKATEGHELWRGTMLGLVGVTIFGLTLPATRIGVGELDPVFFGLGRAIVAGALAAVVLILLRQPWPQRRHIPLLAVTSLGVVIGFPLLATIAMQYAPASHGGVVLALLPLATAFASTVVAGERPSAPFWLCATGGSAAVLIYAWKTGAGETTLHWADLLLVLATGLAAAGYASGGVLARELGGWQVICWALVLGQPVLLAVVALFAEPINWAASSRAWAAFAYVAIFSQFLGFIAWNAGLAIGGIAKIGQLQLLQTFITLAGAALLLGEQITWIEIVFAVIVVGFVGLGRLTHVAGPARR